MRVLITGASRGIGFETALQLLRSGHEVLALARSREGLAQLKEVSGSDRLYLLPFDLSTFDAALLSAEIEALGGLDILINNAGLLLKKPFMELSRADWERSMDVNFFSVVQLIQLCVPFVEKSKQAHILNIGSMGGYPGSAKFPGLAAYSASKAALANLTECLAEELRPQKIAVNCLSLGAVQTEMLETAFPGYQAPITSQDMGAYIADFALKGMLFFNGKVLPVNRSNP